MTEIETQAEQILPAGWTWTPIGEITQPIARMNPRDEPGQRFAYLDISSIDNNANRITKPKIIYGASAPSRARQLVKTGDVLFATVRPYLKNIAIVPERFDKSIASTGFSVLRGEHGVLSKYLFYFCLTDGFITKLGKLQRGTSYPAVRDSDVRGQRVPLAPTAEQNRIVEEIEKQLTRLDVVVSTLQNIQLRLRRARAAVLKAACEGNLVPQDPNDEPASVLLQRILDERRRKWEQDQWAREIEQAKQRAAKDARKAAGSPLKRGEKLTDDEWPGLSEAVYGKYLPKDDSWKQRYQEPSPPDVQGLSELPEGWCWTNLNQLKVFSRYGPRFSSDDYAKNGRLVLRTTDIDDNGGIDFSASPRIPLRRYRETPILLSQRNSG
ncbi:MAG: restriction endonuclease subunit S [Anaerolineae bacterium]